MQSMRRSRQSASFNVCENGPCIAMRRSRCIPSSRARCNFTGSGVRRRYHARSAASGCWIKLADAPTQQYDSVEAAAQAAIGSGRLIFLAMGVNYLASFIQHPDAADRAWYLRLTPDPVKLQRALELGMQRDR